jgi:hypothetical protein
MDASNAPATKQDLRSIAEQLREQKRQIDANLLTEFHKYARGRQTRLHDVESSEHAVKVRLGSLEEQVLELEDRIRRQH